MRFNLFGRTFSFLADPNQQEKAMAMLEKYIFKPEIIVLLTVLAIYLIVFLVAKIKKHEKSLNVLRKMSPWMYLFIILGITILNRTPGDREIRLYHDLWITENGFHESNVLGFLFNLVLCIPYGWLLTRHLKTRVVSVIIIVVTSLSIEIMQYIFARGVTAIDDLISNTIGGLLGLFLAIAFEKIKEKKHKLE